MKKTIGGDRLGAGKKMQVEMHGYGRSTHNKSYKFRTTASTGTLIPFMKQIALPGSSGQIQLNMDIMTHPTQGPLFGSYKAQADIFFCPMRLYQAFLQINMQKIGTKMNTVRLPLMTFFVQSTMNWTIEQYQDLDNSQVSPSCILSYLGVRGFGTNRTGDAVYRSFNAIPWLAYWDIYKTYYANQQEETGYVIHTTPGDTPDEISEIKINGETLSETPTTPSTIPWNAGTSIVITKVTPDPLDTSNIMIMAGNQISPNNLRPLSTMATMVSETATTWTGTSPYYYNKVYYWIFSESGVTNPDKVGIEQFPLENLDQMRKLIMANVTHTTPFLIDENLGLTPYGYVFERNETEDNFSTQYSQEGLGLKTYNSDLFNNWLNKESIDGVGGIAEVTKIDTSDGGFTIDTLNLAKKVYEMLNRIQISGNTYDDWIDATYTERKYRQVNSPVYLGSLIKDVVFEEVTSTAGTEATSFLGQPLGTLAGKGRMGSKHIGGYIEYTADEPGYLMGIFSLTPYQDYSQGNDFDIHLETMDDLHKPALDEIGFQDLSSEQLAWWATYYNGGWKTPVVGKQPAWINYQTETNKVRGNFARKDNEMFMTLNRQYEPLIAGDRININDLTTYIDPRKYNQIFADTSLDSQNFWVQIGVNFEQRNVMSAKIMPMP